MSGHTPWDEIRHKKDLPVGKIHDSDDPPEAPKQIEWHRNTQYHNPRNPDCPFDPSSWSADSSTDYCCCPQPSPGITSKGAVEDAEDWALTYEEPGPLCPFGHRWSDDPEYVRGLEKRVVEGTPGVMHEVDQAFYNLTIQQRNRAWRQLEQLQRELDKTYEIITDLGKERQELEDMLTGCETALHSSKQHELGQMCAIQNDKLEQVAKYRDKLREGVSTSRGSADTLSRVKLIVANHLDQILSG